MILSDSRSPPPNFLAVFLPLTFLSFTSQVTPFIVHEKTRTATVNFVRRASSDGGKQVKKAHGITDRVYNEMFKPIEYRDTWSVIPMILRPYSAGYLKLKSRNPFDKPLIYPNYMLG